MTAPGTGEHDGTLNTVERALQLLELIAAEGPQEWTVREIASRMGTNKSTAHRLMVTLERRGFIQAGHGERYLPGPRLTAIAIQIVDRFELRELAKPIMERIVTACNESVYLTARSGGQYIFMAKAESSNPIKYVVPIGTSTPLHVGAAGKAILSTLPDDQVERIARGPLPAYTATTLVEPTALIEEIKRVRAQGYATSRGERFSEAVGVAAPYGRAASGYHGALTITIPASRFHEADVPQLAALVKSATAQLNQILGVRPADGPR